MADNKLIESNECLRRQPLNNWKQWVLWLYARWLLKEPHSLELLRKNGVLFRHDFNTFLRKPGPFMAMPMGPNFFCQRWQRICRCFFQAQNRSKPLFLMLPKNPMLVWQVLRIDHFHALWACLKCVHLQDKGPQQLHYCCHTEAEWKVHGGTWPRSACNTIQSIQHWMVLQMWPRFRLGCFGLMVTTEFLTLTCNHLTKTIFHHATLIDTHLPRKLCSASWYTRPWARFVPVRSSQCILPSWPQWTCCQKFCSACTCSGAGPARWATTPI